MYGFYCHPSKSIKSWDAAYKRGSTRGLVTNNGQGVGATKWDRGWAEQGLTVLKGGDFPIL